LARHQGLLTLHFNHLILRGPMRLRGRVRGSIRVSSLFPGRFEITPLVVWNACVSIARVYHWDALANLPSRTSPISGTSVCTLRCALPARHTDASCGDGPVSPLSVVSGLRVRIPDEPLPERVIGQLETIRQAQFVENGGQVVVHCCLADKQALRNRPVFQTFSDERDDLRAPGA
jgi:hypothetical protein